jgi:hypothetical protein
MEIRLFSSVEASYKTQKERWPRCYQIEVTE